ELGGLVLDWAPERHPRRYAIDAPDESGGWRTLRTVASGKARDFIHLPETDASALRIRDLDVTAAGCALSEVRVEPPAWGASLESFFRALARDAPSGDYPRAIAGQQSYWTVVGIDGDTREALVSEDGAS